MLISCTESCSGWFGGIIALTVTLECTISRSLCRISSTNVRTRNSSLFGEFNSSYVRKAKKATQKNKKNHRLVHEEESTFFSRHAKIFGQELKAILQKFRLPEEFHSDPKFDQESESMDPKIAKKIQEFKQLYHDGNYFILPSFYEILITLQKLKKRYSVLFRTFGRDFPSVQKELN